MTARASGGQAAAPPQAAVRPRPISPAVPLLIGSAVLACAVATQFLATSLHYSPALGAPAVVLTAAQTFAVKLAAVLVLAGAGVLATARQSWKVFVRGMGVGVLLVLTSLGPLYDPMLGLVWGLRLAHQPAYAGLVSKAALVGAGSGGTAFVTGMLLLPKEPPREPTGSFGTARFGDPEPLKGVTGPIIGRDRGELLRYPGDGHLITFAPTGSGKGVGSVVPNCLTYPGSLVVTDPKGENAAVSRRTRRDDLHQQVAWLDPWRVLQAVGGPVGTDCFNPLDFIDPEGEDANDDAWLIGEQLVPPTYHGSEEGHWLDQARAFLSGLVLHIATRYEPGDPKRSLPHVRDCVCVGDEAFNALLAEMADNTAAGGGVARVATLFKRIMDRSEKEFGSIMSTVARHTWFLDSPRIRKVMESSTFQMDALKGGKLSLFITVPPHRLDTYGAWQRINLACAIAATSRVVGRPEHKVLAIIDEAGNMGTLPELPRTVTLSRGAGLTLWAIFQDISQPKALYNTRWATFLANADVLQSFGTNDHETATLLSAMAGDETIVVESANASASRNRGGKGGGGSSSGSGVTAAERGRKLLLPDEVRRLESNRQLAFLRGQEPLLVDRVNYLRDAEFAGLFDWNPTYNRVGGGRGGQP
ncbi:MAG: conjugal transfer protein TraG [Gemmatimonadetes bacterium]|nr:conjugal transfer protein TraG [Gemmatimonadota bacterium]